MTQWVESERQNEVPTTALVGHWENRAQVFPVGADKLCPVHQGAGTHAEKKVAGRAEAVTRGSVTGTHFHWKLIHMQSTIVNQTLNIAFQSKNLLRLGKKKSY